MGLSCGTSRLVSTLREIALLNSTDATIPHPDRLDSRIPFVNAAKPGGMVTTKTFMCGAAPWRSLLVEGFYGC
jgi:hypothetical protein